MKPKVQLTPLDMDYQLEEQAKIRTRLKELKKLRVVPREKPPANFSFKPMAVDLASPIQIVPSVLGYSPLG